MSSLDPLTHDATAPDAEDATSLGPATPDDPATASRHDEASGATPGLQGFGRARRPSLAFPAVEEVRVHLRVNGSDHVIHCEPRTHLADALREHCGLTATHIGCEHGVCGACTVEVDGMPQRACLQSAQRFEGKAIATLEGMDEDSLNIALRQAFSDNHALQCGYCTPGMLITARDIVRRLPDADEARIREELAGNLCRCTGYRGIVRAIQHVLKTYRPETAHAA